MADAWAGAEVCCRDHQLTNAVLRQILLAIGNGMLVLDRVAKALRRWRQRKSA